MIAERKRARENKKDSKKGWWKTVASRYPAVEGARLSDTIKNNRVKNDRQSTLMNGEFFQVSRKAKTGGNQEERCARGSNGTHAQKPFLPRTPTDMTLSDCTALRFLMRTKYWRHSICLFWKKSFGSSFEQGTGFPQSPKPCCKKWDAKSTEALTLMSGLGAAEAIV